jgi:hypothetical protein
VFPHPAAPAPWPSQTGRTALAIAAVRGNDHCAELLLKGEARVDLGDQDGRTPLLFAAMQAQSACALQLIRAGADVNATERKVRFLWNHLISECLRRSLLVICAQSSSSPPLFDCDRAARADRLALDGSQARAPPVEKNPRSPSSPTIPPFASALLNSC